MNTIKVRYKVTTEMTPIMASLFFMNKKGDVIFLTPCKEEKRYKLYDPPSMVLIPMKITPSKPAKRIVEKPIKISLNKFNLGGAAMLALKNKNHINLRTGFLVAILFCSSMFRDFRAE